MNKKEALNVFLNILNDMIENETDNMEFKISNGKLDFYFDVVLKDVKCHKEEK